MEEVYIVSMARTPIGSLSGILSDYTATQLGAHVIKSALERAGISPDVVEEVFMGNVLQANNGQAPARIATLAAGLPVSTVCTTVNKVCASGMKAIMLGYNSIKAGDKDVVIAGGMESMTNSPYYLPKGRGGMRFGNSELLDAIVRDGLQDPYTGYMMGNAAEVCAEKCEIPREAQDAYALASYQRATDAYKAGAFAAEIAPLIQTDRKGNTIAISEDEEYKKLIPEKVATLKPAFKTDGTVTAVNASKINDGAAAVVLMSGEAVKKYNVKPLARILSVADAAQQPEWFTTTPSLAIPKALSKVGLHIEQVDVFEVNEAFSVVAIANYQKMQIPHDKINILGGAVALGHPIGASGCRIVCTLISALVFKGGKIGAAGICNGGGGASAMVIERV